jgi:hypothetical protein
MAASLCRARDSKEWLRAASAAARRLLSNPTDFSVRDAFTVRHPTVPWESVAVKKVSYTFAATVVVLLFTALATSYPAGAAVGRTSGTFAVSSSGAASYTIPIWAPRRDLKVFNRTLPSPTTATWGPDTSASAGASQG